MVPLIATEILRAVVLGLILSLLFGAIAGWIWTLRRLLRNERLLPAAPLVERSGTPWGIGTILLVLVAYVVVSHQTFRYFATSKPAAEEAAARAPVDPEADGPEETEADSPGDRLPPLELMTIQGALNGVFLVLLPGLAWLTCRARPRDFGLSLRDWRRQAAVGLVAVLVLMPVVYAVQTACVALLQFSEQEREQFKHPLEKMLRETFTPGVACLAFVSAVILAPAFEELLFRGFFQSWLVKAFDRLADLFRATEPPTPLARPSTIEAEGLAREWEGEAPPEPSAARAEPRLPESAPSGTDSEPEPPAGGLAAEPDAHAATAVTDPDIGDWDVADVPTPLDRFDGRTPEAPKTYDPPRPPRGDFRAGAAIAVTSLIFAALHAPQWPAPIPLFLLAMGLGVVYHRTGSLLASICMHAVFNSFSTLMLFLVALEGPDKEQPPPRPVLERIAPSGGPAAPDVAPPPRSGET